MYLLNLIKNYGLYNYAVASQTKTNLYDVYYVDPSKTKITFPEHKKNLIYIFFGIYGNI